MKDDPRQSTAYAIVALLSGTLVLLLGTVSPVPRWYYAHYHPDRYSETLVLLTSLPFLFTLIQ
jgi:hypothetical protein